MASMLMPVGTEALRQTALAVGINPIEEALCDSPVAYAAALEDGLRRIVWANFPYVPRWQVRSDASGTVAVTMEYRVPDRDTGEARLVVDTDTRVPTPMEPEDIVMYARYRVRGFAIHEVDEGLRLGAERPFDSARGGLDVRAQRRKTACDFPSPKPAAVCTPITAFWWNSSQLVAPA